MSTTALPPDLSRLLAFVRVVEAGSFAEAARRAGTTTSAMSKAVARFERAHGMQLLHRSTHSLALTEEGDRLMTAGRALADSLVSVQSALGEVVRSDGGRVRVTAPSSFARACILPRLPTFLRERPEIEVEVKFRNELLDLTAEGVDVAIRSGPLDRAPGLQARRLCTFSWKACASPAYLKARGTPATPYDLSAHDLVGFRNPANGQILTWRFAERGRGVIRVSPKPRHICDDAHAALALVVEGFGIGWGPAWLLQDDLRTGRLVEVLTPWRAPAEPLWMLRTSDRRPPLRTQRVMAFLATLPSAFNDDAREGTHVG